MPAQRTQTVRMWKFHRPSIALQGAWNLNPIHPVPGSELVFNNECLYCYYKGSVKKYKQTKKSLTHLKGLKLGQILQILSLRIDALHKKDWRGARATEKPGASSWHVSLAVLQFSTGPNSEWTKSKHMFRKLGTAKRVILWHHLQLHKTARTSLN